MPKRIWFTQQKSFDYIPLRMGLGYIKAQEIYNDKGNGLTYVPKLYTTRTHPLSGEYVVVEGNRLRAKPVIPEIRFRVSVSEELDLRRAIFKKNDSIIGWAIANRNGLTFPELDLGYMGATFGDLRNELLRLNKKVTIDAPFYVNLLEPITDCIKVD